MLELYEYDTLDNSLGTDGMIAFLHEAAGVRIRKEINVSDELTFTYPLASDKAKLITVNRLVSCEGQFYRIMKVKRGGGIVEAEASHTFFADAPAVHIPTVADSIGVVPYDLISSAASGAAGFKILSRQQMKNAGMSWIGEGSLLRTVAGSDGEQFKIDFFAVDKTNLLDFIKTVIENAGFGEIYYDNRSFAVAEQIGKQTGIRLELSSNMESVRTETDISSMITRLYPYGCDDMTVGSVCGQNYIDSPNIPVYGLKSGYKDYSDYTNAQDLYCNACWEFDLKNPDRIDVPSVSVDGSAAGLEAYSSGGDVFALAPGDTVTVIDEAGTELVERVTAVSYYPYEGKPADISIGRVKRDLYFYISQIAEMAKRYAKCSTTSGKIAARSVETGRSGNL